jgi:hypothetical protein
MALPQTPSRLRFRLLDVEYRLHRLDQAREKARHRELHLSIRADRLQGLPDFVTRSDGTPWATGFADERTRVQRGDPSATPG